MIFPIQISSNVEKRAAKIDAIRAANSALNRRKTLTIIRGLKIIIRSSKRGKVSEKLEKVEKVETLSLSAAQNLSIYRSLERLADP